MTSISVSNVNGGDMASRSSLEHRKSLDSGETAHLHQPTPSPARATFSLRTGRLSSSATSSLQSSPTIHDGSEFPVVSVKKPSPGGLPELTEEPMELEARDHLPPSPVSPKHNPQNRWSHDSPRRPVPSARFTRRSVDTQDWSADASLYAAKRRRSGDYTLSGIADGLRSSLGSLSKRSRPSKRMSASFLERTSRFLSPPPSRSPTPTRGSRSISRTQSLREIRHSDEVDAAGLHFDTIMEDDAHDISISQFDGAGDDEFSSFRYRSPTPEPRSRTPLLPQFNENSKASEPLQSPLQSPTIAPSTQADYATPAKSSTDTRKSTAMMTPPLSHQASVASFHRSRASTGVNTSDIPAMFIADGSDKWSELLGHNNFEIAPVPYIPEVSDIKACEQLMADWTHARTEYARHRYAIQRDYGVPSRIYRITEEKWATIDAEWKRCNDIASRRAVASGAMQTSSPLEPAPLPTIPQLNDRRIVQSSEIVGPMEVGPAQETTDELLRRPSKKDQILKLLIPNRIGRSFSGGGRR